LQSVLASSFHSSSEAEDAGRGPGVNQLAGSYR
jgi:hypothetical protein